MKVLKMKAIQYRHMPRINTQIYRYYLIDIHQHGAYIVYLMDTVKVINS